MTEPYGTFANIDGDASDALAACLAGIGDPGPVIATDGAGRHWTATHVYGIDEAAHRAVALRRHPPAQDDEAGLPLGAPGVLWMAMRYALGRRSYAVGEACDAILENLDRLNRWQARAMAVEIEYHLDLVKAAEVSAADLDDRWRATAAVLRERAGELS